MACQDIVEMLNDYLEGTLPAEERAHVQGHLDGCDGCSRALDQFRSTIATTGRLTEDRLSEDQRSLLLEAFRHHAR
jgi:anti-sigma factor RsiW